jgi:hypothetical protein
MKDFFLKLSSIDISFLIVGALGGLLAMNSKENRKKTRWERFIIGISGVCSAALLTPVFIWIVEMSFSVKMPVPVQLGMAYLCGQLGLEVINWFFDLFDLIKEFKQFRNIKNGK